MEYDDYNAVDSSGRDRFGRDNYGGSNDNDVVRINNRVPVVDRSTNLVDFSSDMFGSGMANTWDRLTNNTADRFLNNLDFGNARTFDAFFSGNPLNAMPGPISGDDSVYDPLTGRGYEIIDRNKTQDFFANLIGTIANPVPGLAHSFDTARVRDDLTGNVMNFESNQGYLDSSRLLSDEALAQEQLEQQQRMAGNGDNTRSIDNTGGMLATRDENGDIPWWVLANAGLLAV